MLLTLAGLLLGAAQTQAADSPYWQIQLEQGAVTALRHAPAGDGAYGANLVYRPLRLVTASGAAAGQGLQATLTGEALVLTYEETDEPLSLEWAVDFSPDGYYDRLTGQTTDAPADNPALLTFISGGRGHYYAIEAFKRIDPVRLPALHLGALVNAGGKSTLVETRNGFVRIGHGSEGHGARFRYVDGALVVRFPVAGGRIELRPYDASAGFTLEGGERLPAFAFGEDAAIENSLGGTTRLNALFNQFYHQAAFWYPGGHGISAWSAWGPLGHAYVDSPYRIDSRNALMSQIIADDGHGNDGYAWTWGDQRGWPFPRGYDTRHFGINAMHICGVRTYLLWTGEYHEASGIDFCLRARSGAETILDQRTDELPVALINGAVYAQTFQSPAPFDALELKLRVDYDLLREGPGLTEAASVPRLTNRQQPFALADADGGLVAQRIAPAARFNTVGARFCSWSTPGNTVRLRVFPWRGGFDATLEGEPLAVVESAPVRDNEYLYALLPETLPAGTEVLYVADAPAPPEALDEATAGVWLAERDGGPPPTLIGGQPNEGWTLQMSHGVRLRPELALRVLDDAGGCHFDETVELGAATAYLAVPFQKPLAPGAYTVEARATGASVAWYASRQPTALGGRAAYNGHSWNWLDRARRAMDYQMGLLNAAEEGLLLLEDATIEDHSGVGGVTVGNNYYDILPFGYFDAYSNAWYYKSLQAMADLEQAWGLPERADHYAASRPKAQARYNELFWTTQGFMDGAARYIGCVDATGARHDYGFSFVNTLALEAGLARPEQGEAVLTWLDEGNSYGPGGSPVGAIYAFEFGPRTTTIDNPDWWAVRQRYEAYPWGDQIQNGGADLYESYYDLKARLRYRGADDAYERLLAILKRYAEPDRLTGGSPLFTGQSVQGGGTAGAAGIMSHEFPETAILAGIVLYGFLGAEARADGLHLTPQVPTRQPWLEARNVLYHGAHFDFRADHAGVRIRCNAHEGRYRFRVGDHVRTPPFEVTLPYASAGSVVIEPVARAEGS